jgi:hypothetical protein
MAERRMHLIDASEAIDPSQRFLGWQVAEEGKPIPCAEVVLGTPRPPTQKEIEYGRRLALELGGSPSGERP